MEKDNNKPDFEVQKKNSRPFNGKNVTRLLLTSLFLSAFILVIGWGKFLSGYQPSAGVNFLLYGFSIALFLYWIYVLLLVLPDLFGPIAEGISCLVGITRKSCRKAKQKYGKHPEISLPKEQLVFVKKYVTEDYKDKPVTLALTDVLSEDHSGSWAILVFYCAHSMLKWINAIPIFADANSCFPDMVGSKSNYYEQKKEEKLFFDIEKKQATSKKLREALKKHTT